MAKSARQAAALIRFQYAMVETLAFIVVELGKLTEGKVPDETKRAIHERLRVLSEKALEVPDGRTVLPLFDGLVAMFPPPDPTPPSD